MYDTQATNRPGPLNNMIMEWIQTFQGPLTCSTYMTHTFYIDATGVNGRQLVKLFSVFYEIHIVEQSNKYRFTHLEWSAVYEQTYS